ncbi:4-phosphopantoate--beta-alanine ligase [Nocardia cyriacigeorgica]|uniref:pantoate--beta-alanine ligase n=1 Tax=Nocardia cyriacigeorgica TaxID=135487 RepID=UPI00189340FD|nr:pantoate--beta-alanine ligase [Nocardia cyriacigeorgica]MBF6397890.1 4-phosphopantoate--beta-alanine ligase [Nocardia cyriacigeorgica]MBF6402453.1 4-phosphopantoate--beta-alanine ligase [Nocardia cyriacigeorgica]
MTPVRIIRSVAEARPILRDLWRSGATVGSIHTLGALHNAHGELIKRSSSENDHTIVTVYPNKIQLFDGCVYQYDLDEDIDLAQRCGATIVIATDDAEMYPPDYATYIDQGPRAKRLNSSIFDYASRGQVTGAIRWISLCRPTVSYFGMKDIEQSLLVERAVTDLLIDCEIRHVPCVRDKKSKIPVSSRLRFLSPERLQEVGTIYDALESGRHAVLAGTTDADAILAGVRQQLDNSLSTFEVIYLALVDASDFGPIASARLPFILHCAITDGSLTHFDGLCIRTEDELAHSPDVIWI